MYQSNDIAKHGCHCTNCDQFFYLEKQFNEQLVQTELKTKNIQSTELRNDTQTKTLTLKVFEVVFVGVCEAPHGAVIELLEEAHILGPVQQPLPGGAHQEHIGVALLTIQASSQLLLHQQLRT